MSSPWNIGSRWHRWDPHIHTPGTLANDQFGGAWDAYLAALSSAQPAVEAVGVTDYCLPLGYRAFRAHWMAGRVPGVAFIFPNVEFRLTVPTRRNKGINIHLLFSPEDPHHDKEIDRALALLSFEFRDKTYKCTEGDLIDLGRAFDPKQTDDRGALRTGVGQFKLDVKQLKEVMESDWLRRNCLVALCANEGDGTGGIRDGQFAALRQELEAFANVILSSSPADREFWLGRADGFDVSHIEGTYGCLKPCLHGCDAHRLEEVAKPDDDRRCWVRSELTFSGLRQVLLEPDARVWIGKEPPSGAARTETIRSLSVEGAGWFRPKEIELNDGLVTIIGPKGSGKTALADIIARSAGAEVHGDASFLGKAGALLANASGSLLWANDEAGTSVRLQDPSDDDLAQPAVRYLSQRFVDRLCSADGLNDELIAEIERVVFHSIPEEDRLGSHTFTELRDESLTQALRERERCRARTELLTRTAGEEEEKLKRLPVKRKELADLERQLAVLDKEVKDLLPKANDKVANHLAALQAEIESRTAAIQRAKSRLKRLGDLRAEYAALKTTVRDTLALFKTRYADLELKHTEWSSLLPQFSADGEAALVAAEKRLSKVVVSLEAPAPLVKVRLSTWPLAALRAELTSAQKNVGLEEQRAKRYRQLVERSDALKKQMEKLKGVIKDYEGARDRIKTLLADRRKEYAAVFDTLVSEEQVLRDLYAPLQAHLGEQQLEERRLTLEIDRRIDLESWIERGEALLDLRVAGAFQGKGALRRVVDQKLAPAWATGDSSTVAAAMEHFIATNREDLVKARLPSVTVQQQGRWLFSTGHISIVYSIQYDGVDISRLSPGMRGIVLLMLYLSVDQWDSRPLIVDQPEENLDPQSVYDQLVGYFRAAKRRRQVVIVTHNPNLVVNADADQVIVADAERRAVHELPRIRYVSGGLEDPAIRDHVCRVLEGGERAFRDRERRYDLRHSRRAR